MNRIAVLNRKVATRITPANGGTRVDGLKKPKKRLGSTSKDSGDGDGHGEERSLLGFHDSSTLSTSMSELVLATRKTIDDETKAMEKLRREAAVSLSLEMYV